MLFEDYKQEVLKAYHNKKNSGKLSDNLAMPTPRKVKDECLIVLARRYDKKDDEVIRLFFDPLHHYNDHAKSIERIEIDKFKPLINFVKGEINRTEDKNVKLLAWLIDFEPRPYKFIVPPVVEDDKKGNQEENKGNALVDTTAPQPIGIFKPDRKPISNRLKLIALLFIFLTTSGVYLAKRQSAIVTYTGQEKCMYWAEDHYQPISCTQKMDDALVIALDTVRLLAFKKITTPDTISIKSVGKVYYFKRNNRLEFFTAGGFHPVYIDRKLKPLTAYMLANYAK